MALTNQRGIFSVEDVRLRQNTGYWPTSTGSLPTNNPLQIRPFGYFGGGFPGPTSTVDRIDYSNDTSTASVKGPLTSGKALIAAASSLANGLPQ